MHFGSKYLFGRPDEYHFDNDVLYRDVYKDDTHFDSHQVITKDEFLACFKNWVQDDHSVTYYGEFKDKQVYSNKEYKDACDMADHIGYFRGLKEAWELARKIVKNSVDKNELEFKCKEPLLDYTVFEAIDRSAEYVDFMNFLDADIAVGDEVQSYDVKYIVVRINEQRRTFEGIGACGVDMDLKLENFHKTGRHFDEIENLMSAFKGNK